MSRIERRLNRIDRITGRLDTIGDKLDYLSGLPTNERRAERIERLLAREEMLNNLLQELEQEVVAYELETTLNVKAARTLAPAAAIEPDRFDISFTPGTGYQGLDQINFGIYNSLEDDTYLGNEPLLMQVRGTKSIGGRTINKTRRSTLANGDYWEGGSQQVISAGGSILKTFEDFDQFTVTIATSPEEGLRAFNQDDILTTQTFDVADFI